MDNIIPQKRCAVCKDERPLTFFYKNRSRPDGLSTECKQCAKDRQKTRDRTNSPTRTMRYVSLTREMYEQIWSKQQGKCAICGLEETYKNQWGIKKLAVDHDHETGKFRGLLCTNCNIRLAIVEDKAFIEAAMRYLFKGKEDA